MALEASDLMMLKSANGGMSPYETAMLSEKASRRPSGTAIAGLVLGSVGAAAAIGAWIFGGTYASAKSNGVAALAAANHENTERTIDRLATLLAQERNERVNGDINLTQTVTDTQSGSQQGSIAAQIENSAVSQATAQVMAGLMTGNYSENPQKVQIYSAPQPCGCPGCNG